MKTKTVELNPDQIKFHYVPVDGKCYTHSVKIELIDTNIDVSLITRIKFPTLDLVPDGEKKPEEAKVKVTYLDLSDKDKKYATKLRNWISPKQG